MRTGWIRSSWPTRWLRSSRGRRDCFEMSSRRPPKTSLETFSVSCGMPGSIFQGAAEGPDVDDRLRDGRRVGADRPLWSPRNGGVPVALHNVDERAQRGRDLAATRIVEVKSGEAGTPVIEHAFEGAAGEVWRHLRLEREADHLAGQHRELGDTRIVLEQRAGHRDLALAATLLQLPPVRLATRPRVHDAPVREQVLWLPR